MHAGSEHEVGDAFRRLYARNPDAARQIIPASGGRLALGRHRRSTFPPLVEVAAGRSILDAGTHG
jgi:hypothetical protein